MGWRPKILVAYDFSAAAERALLWAATLRRELGGGEILLLNVVSSMPSTFAMMTPAPAVPFPTVEEQRRVEEALRAAGVKHGIEATARMILAPNLPEAILDEARRWPADLIAMGTHGRGVVASAFLGSVAHHVVRHASCPVVTLRAGEA